MASGEMTIEEGWELDGQSFGEAVHVLEVLEDLGFDGGEATGAETGFDLTLRDADDGEDFLFGEVHRLSEEPEAAEIPSLRESGLMAAEKCLIGSGHGRRGRMKVEGKRMKGLPSGNLERPPM
jgi:hypothetical protein